MKRNRLLFQALVVTLMGLAAHLTRPAPAASAAVQSEPCQQSTCTSVCYAGSYCDLEVCGQVCVPPPNEMCGSVRWYVACYEPM